LRYQPLFRWHRTDIEELLQAFDKAEAKQSEAKQSFCSFAGMPTAK